MSSELIELHIVVGTHTVLSADIEYARLGLLVVDEEQKLGLRQKEVLAMATMSLPSLAVLVSSVTGPYTLSIVASQSGHEHGSCAMVLLKQLTTGRHLVLYKRSSSRQGRRDQFTCYRQDECRSTRTHGSISSPSLSSRRHLDDIDTTHGVA